MAVALPLVMAAGSALAAPTALTAIGATAETASTLADIGTAFSIGSSVLGAFGDIQQGQANKASSKYNAEVSQENAQIAQQSASLAGAAGEAQAEQAALKTRAQVGAIVANEAAGNVDVTSGSALQVRSSAQQLGELNALSVRSNAARTAYGYQTQSSNDTAQSQLYNYQANQAMPSAYLAAGGSLLGGLGGAASRYAQFQLSANGGALNGGGSPYGETPGEITNPLDTYSIGYG